MKLNRTTVSALALIGTGVAAQRLSMVLLISTVFAGCSKDDKTTTVTPPVIVKSIGAAQVYLTSGDQSHLLSKGADLTITATATTNYPIISVDSIQKFQEMDGFGGALTGSSAYVIHNMGESARASLLTDLFDPRSGIGISYIRTSIGASDFSLKDYSYDDMPAGETDSTLVNFSLDVDKADVIPILQSIIAISPDIKILGSPWSPPGWMKTTGKMEGGSLLTKYYGTYAHYFVNYVQAMKAEGITIESLTMQNEPLYSTATYPCMSMTSVQQNDFIKNYVGPLFASENITAKIFAYDHNWDQAVYPTSIVTDPVTRQYVAGSAFHGYGGNVASMSQVHTAAPDKGLYFTEFSGGSWSPSFSDNLNYFMGTIFIGTINNWSKNVMLWNIALNENTGPENNGCHGCRPFVTIISGSGSVVKNLEYYVTAHFSKFVRPGAFRIASVVNNGTLTSFDFVAFQNPDGSKVFVGMNESGASQTFYIQQPLRQILCSVPANTAVTVVWK